LVEDRGRWLVNRRLSGDELRGLWEFPGGKAHDGETARQAAVRECREELGIEVEPTEALSRVRFEYPEKVVELHPFRCRLVSGEPRPNAAEIGEIRWVDAHELRDLPMPPGNAPILDELLDRRPIR